jgi:hypothetical protein
MKALMKNRFVAFWLAVVVLAGSPSWSAAADPAAVLLTVTGNIQPAKAAAGKKVTFNFKELSALGTTSIRATTTYAGNAEYTGPLMKDVLIKAGMPATAKEVILRGLDGYQSRVPVSDFMKWEVVLAHTQDGKRLEIETKGPLLVMYPSDKYPKELRTHTTYGKQVWALVSINVQ